MFAPISTDRLLIRTVAWADLDALVARRDDPDVARHQAWSVPYTRDRAEPWVREIVEAGGFVDDRWWMGTLVERAGGEVVGDVVVRSEWEGRAAEIGYTLARAHWGRGFASEAVAALLDHLFDDLGVTRVHATMHPENVASARVVEGAGFLHEGHTRSSWWVGDDTTDDWLYGCTSEDRAIWTSRPSDPPHEVRLVEITPDNSRTVLRLRTHKTQEAFVAPNVHSFADALVPEVIDGAPVVPWYRAIEADGELVGFVMVADVSDHHPEPYLWRLMIDRLHQRRGIGARALDLVEDRARRAGGASIVTSWVDGPGSPRRFYESRGYVATGEIVDGEIEARLVL